MDQILMKGLQFYGYHGVLEAEQVLGQKFTVHVIVHCSLKEAGLSDDLSHTISYADLYTIVSDCVTMRRFKLIEALAETIALEILKNDNRIAAVDVEIEKPEAPINGLFNAFGVRIKRSQQCHTPT